MKTTVIAIGFFALVIEAEALQRPESERRAINLFPAEPLPKDVSAAIAISDSFVLYSLDPNGGAQPHLTGTFRGWRVLGQTHITDAATRKRISRTIIDSVAHADGTGARCFIPHHGLRFTSDKKTYDLVICFMCNYLNIYTTRRADRFARISSGAEVLDAVFTAAQIPMAVRQK